MDGADCINSKGTVFCFITGASEGFGRAVALSIASSFNSAGSCIVLVSRNSDNLSKVKTKILENNPELTVLTVAEDLSHITKEKAEELLLKTKGASSFDQAILVHNVGSVGNISVKVDELDDFSNIRDYFDLNVTSVFVLTSVFLKVFNQLLEKPKCCLVINVTSLAAIQPFCGWAQYCTGKAAREQYFKVLAEEFPNVSVLSYSPGPMKTAMTTEVLNHALPTIREWFQSATSEGRLLNCESSAKKLVAFLKKGDFKSGSRIDYYDIELDCDIE